MASERGLSCCWRQRVRLARCPLRFSRPPGVAAIGAAGVAVEVVPAKSEATCGVEAGLCWVINGAAPTSANTAAVVQPDSADGDSRRRGGADAGIGEGTATDTADDSNGGQVA